MENQGEVIIYQTEDGRTELDVRLTDDTVWLTQSQIAELFCVDRTSILRHISNIYRSGELIKEQTCVKIAQVQIEGRRTVRRTIPTYNLDVILSVGYRVNSKYATLFRIWANQVLKAYLVKGYAINHHAQLEQLENLKRTIAVMSEVLSAKQVTKSEAIGMLRVLSDFAYGLDTLDRYDYQQLTISDTTTQEPFRATYEAAIEAIDLLRSRFPASELFGHQKDASFRSTMGVLYQTFDGKELYPSVEEKAANLLYLTTKNHSFSDGNKRIAAYLFLWFLEKNGILYRSDGSCLLDNNTLVALTLMIAESRTEEKDIMTKVIVNLINKKN